MDFVGGAACEEAGERVSDRRRGGGRRLHVQPKEGRAAWRHLRRVHVSQGGWGLRQGLRCAQPVGPAVESQPRGVSPPTLTWGDSLLLAVRFFRKRP